MLQERKTALSTTPGAALANHQENVPHLDESVRRAKIDSD